MGHAPSTASGAKYYGAVSEKPPRKIYVVSVPVQNHTWRPGDLRSIDVNRLAATRFLLLLSTMLVKT